MSSFKSSAIVVSNKTSSVSPTISGDLSIVARNDHLQVFNGTTEQQVIYTAEVGSISGSLNTLISNEVTNRTNADLLLIPLNGFAETMTYNISGALDTLVTLKGTKTFNYDISGKLISIVGTGSYVSKNFLYDPQDKLTEITII